MSEKRVSRIAGSLIPKEERQKFSLVLTRNELKKLLKTIPRTMNSTVIMVEQISDGQVSAID